MVDDMLVSPRWEFKTRLSGRELAGYDFTGTDFNDPVFSEVVFSDCVFEGCHLGDARTYDCIFRRCTFRSVDLRYVTIGAHGGLFEDCVFERCDFRRGSFFRPDFVGCIFDACRWGGADLRCSSFERCRFIGKMSDVIFRGLCEDLEGEIRVNQMVDVDFSDAILGSGVAFDGCDLSCAVPPRGHVFADLLAPSEHYDGMMVVPGK